MRRSWRTGCFPDFFKKDLMPFIESKYAVRTDQGGARHRGAFDGVDAGGDDGVSKSGAVCVDRAVSGFLRNYIGVEEVEDAHLRGVLDDPQAFHESCRLLFRAMGREDVFFPYLWKRTRSAKAAA